MGEVSESTAENLEQLRKIAVDTNSEFATILGIPQSAAITCVKPSGTVSQLVDSAGHMGLVEFKELITIRLHLINK